MAIDFKKEQEDLSKTEEKIGLKGKKPVEPNMSMVKLSMAQLKAVKEKSEENWPKGSSAITLDEARVLLRIVAQVEYQDSQLNGFFKIKGHLLDKISRD